MTNKEIIKKVKEWQWSSCVHPLTCGSDKCHHINLKPVEKEGKVILKCISPNCDYEQEYIPEIILKTNIKELEKSRERMLREMEGK